MTRSCAAIRPVLELYVDGELETAESLAVEAHLMDCSDCRAAYESLLQIVGSIRTAHPLYAAPIESLEKARLQVEAYKRAQRDAALRMQRRRQLWLRGGIAAAILVTVLTAYVFVRGRHSELASFAAEHHLRYTRGALPLDIQSSAEREVESWLTPKLAFPLRLPEYSGQSNAERPYRLVGARLLQYRDADAAFLAYEIKGRPVSLVIASSQTAGARGFPSGPELGDGDSQKIGRLTFHTSTQQGLSAINWVDQGLSYSLISESGKVSAEGCVICHSRAADAPKFTPFKPAS